MVVLHSPGEAVRRSGLSLDTLRDHERIGAPIARTRRDAEPARGGADRFGGRAAPPKGLASHRTMLAADKGARR